jgi:hypothetical protein
MKQPLVRELVGESRRLGKMVRVSRQHVHYYTTDTRTIHLVARLKALRQGQRG